MDTASMRADCTRCAALCCVALAFDRSPSFAIDKPNGVPCPKLDGDLGCSVYDHRERLGFVGCVRFECYGAGQRVTQEVFGGRSWKDDAGLLPAMTQAFSALRDVHELLLLLREAARAPLAPSERQELDDLERALTPADGWSAASLDACQRKDVPGRARAFLASLKHHFELVKG